jgi:hypothetical protein
VVACGDSDFDADEEIDEDVYLPLLWLNDV